MDGTEIFNPGSDFAGEEEKLAAITASDELRPLYDQLTNDPPIAILLLRAND